MSDNIFRNFIYGFRLFFQSLDDWLILMSFSIKRVKPDLDYDWLVRQWNGRLFRNMKNLYDWEN